MPPPTSTDDTQGTVIDGTARSADWRQQQRAAQRPHNPGSPGTSPGAPASDFDPAAAKDFVSSLMIPASKLADQSRQTTAAPEAPDPYINTLLNDAQKRQATQELEIDASVNPAHGEELDRWFDEQATSVPHAPAGQTLPAGSASLDSETAAAAGVERGPRVRALRLPRAPARETENQRPRPTGRRRLRTGMRLTRTRILAGTTLTILSIAAIAIAAGGSPGHRPPIRSTTASTSTIFAGLGDTLLSAAAGLQTLERLRARARPHQRPSHRTHRAPARRPIAHPRVSTGAAPSSSYTPRLASQTDASSESAASASPSTTTGGTAATESGSRSGSSPAASSSPQARTGPSGPISLIGAGTTPSG